MPEYMVKAVKRLPNHLRKSFYKSQSNIILERNSFVSLDQFENWLDTKVNEQFNPIANIISVDKIYLIKSNNINQDEFQEIKCRFCSDDHKLGSCNQFLSKPSHENKRFVEKEKLCWNCLATGHILKSCPSKVNCRITMQANQSIASNNLNNNLEKKQHVFTNYTYYHFERYQIYQNKCIA